MDLEEAVTVTKLFLRGERCYLLIGWQMFAFEMYIYGKEKLWKGTFTPSRLSGFSKNLQMTEDDYFKSLKRCLSEKREVYHYELKSGFFYWKRKLKDSVLIEGFLPLEATISPKNAKPDLIEVLMTLNNQLNRKANLLMQKFTSIKDDYQKCLKDTEEFLNLKIEMEKALCNKFLNLVSIQNSKVDAVRLDIGKASAGEKTSNRKNLLKFYQRS